MKRWSINAAAAVITAWLVTDLVRESVASFRYFSSEPAKLLYVAGIIPFGGFAAWGFDRLSPRAQRSAKIFAWGATAGTLTAFVAWLGISLVSITTTGIAFPRSLVLIFILLLSGICAGLWFEFYRTLKTRVSQQGQGLKEIR